MKLFISTETNFQANFFLLSFCVFRSLLFNSPENLQKKHELMKFLFAHFLDELPGHDGKSGWNIMKS